MSWKVIIYLWNVTIYKDAKLYFNTYKLKDNFIDTK